MRGASENIDFFWVEKHYRGFLPLYVPTTHAPTNPLKPLLPVSYAMLLKIAVITVPLL